VEGSEAFCEILKLREPPYSHKDFVGRNVQAQIHDDNADMHITFELNNLLQKLWRLKKFQEPQVPMIDTKDQSGLGEKPRVW
jgi:hypothetical protein